MRIQNRRDLKVHRKKLRNHGTSAEATLWLLLKGKRFERRKFRRQHSIGKFVVDFYCPSEKLVIELDGEQHFTDEGIEHDEKRAQYFKELGILTIRFENWEIFERQDAVLQEIRKWFRG